MGVFCIVPGHKVQGKHGAVERPQRKAMRIPRGTQSRGTVEGNWVVWGGEVWREI